MSTDQNTLHTICTLEKTTLPSPNVWLSMQLSIRQESMFRKWETFIRFPVFLFELKIIKDI
jgi:hypothetical protein